MPYSALYGKADLSAYVASCSKLEKAGFDKCGAHKACSYLSPKHYILRTFSVRPSFVANVN